MQLFIDMFTLSREKVPVVLYDDVLRMMVDEEDDDCFKRDIVSFSASYSQLCATQFFEGVVRTVHFTCWITPPVLSHFHIAVRRFCQAI